MLILALDLGRWLGYVYGESSEPKPLVGVEHLAPKESVERRAGALGSWLSQFLENNPHPDKIAVENYMNPAAIAQSGIGTADAIVGQIMLHGSLHGKAGELEIDVESVEIAAARKHFCGRSSAMPVIRGHKRTSAEKNAARKATKQMVINRAMLLGYLQKEHALMSFEDQCALADASCIFDWAKTHLAREAGPLVLFQ